MLFFANGNVKSEGVPAWGHPGLLTGRQTHRQWPFIESLNDAILHSRPSRRDLDQYRAGRDYDVRRGRQGDRR